MKYFLSLLLSIPTLSFSQTRESYPMSVFEMSKKFCLDFNEQLINYDMKIYENYKSAGVIGSEDEDFLDQKLKQYRDGEIVRNCTIIAQYGLQAAYNKSYLENSPKLAERAGHMMCLQMFDPKQVDVRLQFQNDLCNEAVSTFFAPR